MVGSADTMLPTEMTATQPRQNRKDSWTLVLQILMYLSQNKLRYQLSKSPSQSNEAIPAGLRLVLMGDSPAGLMACMAVVIVVVGPGDDS